MLRGWTPLLGAMAVACAQPVVPEAGPPDLIFVDQFTRDFAPPPDLFGRVCTPKTTPCDVVCQNCDSGDKCTADGSKFACTPAGKLVDGDECGKTGGDNCAMSLVCVTELTTPKLSLCRRYCREDIDCLGGLCVFPLTGTMAKVCSEPISGCDPTATGNCPAGHGCYPVTPDGQTACHRTGSGGEGATCETSYACQSGFACIDLGAERKCLRVCPRAKSGFCGTKSCASVTYTGGVWPTYGACN